MRFPGKRKYKGFTLTELSPTKVAIYDGRYRNLQAVTGDLESARTWVDEFVELYGVA